MGFQGILSRGIVLSCVALLMMGTKACREDYCVGCEVSLGTVTPTGTPNDDDTTGTRTPTPTGTITTTLTPTPTGTIEVPTATPSATETVGTASSRSFFQELSIQKKKPGSTNRKNLNWLGAPFRDSDKDGFSDRLEDKLSTDKKNGGSYPRSIPSKLSSRLALTDIDGDGLTAEEEKRLGTNPNKPDSDGDGCSDSAEILSESDPLDSRSVSTDDDNDCLSSAYEKEIGVDPERADSDDDGLRDDLELALSSDPLNFDSDDDGILDGTEVRLGSDPLVPDFME